MARAAVPGYLGADFSSASPGLRFGMYLPLWGVDERSGELLWSTFDQNYRAAGRDREVRQFRDENKSQALRQACRLGPGDKTLMVALRKRQAAVGATISYDQLLRMEALAVAPFSTGLGNEHPLESGFAFLNPYGLPYLPGSGVKGVLHKAACELADGLFGGSAGWTHRAIDALFGSANDREDNGRRGALIVWDVLPEIAGEALKVEVMTAHQSHYLQGTEWPHESGQPNPINFLAVPPQSHFDFHIQCDLPFLARCAPELATEGGWKQLIDAALRHAFEWLGFGAKTAVGYGAMQVDPQAAKRREQVEAARREAEERQRKEREHAERLATMSPVDREMQQYLDARPDKNVPEISALIGALKTNQWHGDMKRDVAIRLRERMQAEKGKWKETTEAKKPDKDKEYQNTKLVMGWIEGR